MAKKPRVIIEALPDAAVVVTTTGGRYFGGFIEFVREQGVVGVAIGLVIGGAATTLVKSLIDNVVMPPIGVLLGSADGLRGLSIDMGTYGGKVAELRYGQLLSDLVNFMIIALVVYVVVKLLKVDKLDKKKA